MKILDFVNQQAVKAGIDISGDTHKAALDALGLITAEIPDDIAKGLDSKFITLDAAGNNHPTIKAIYQKQTLDTLDKKMKEGLLEVGVTQDVIDQIFKDEPSAYNRTAVALKTIKELENKKANAGKPDQIAIQKQIDDLNAALRLEKETTQKTIAQKAEFEKSMKLSRKKERIFSKLKTVYDTLDPEDKLETLDVIINRALQESSAVLDFDDNGNLALYKKTGDTRTNFFGENNTHMTPEQFIDGIMSKKKLLVVSAPATPNGAPSKNGPNAGAPAGNGNGDTGKGAASPLFNALLKESQDDFKNAAAV